MKLIWKQLPAQCKEFEAKLVQIAIYDLHTGNEKCLIILDEDPIPFFEQMQAIVSFCKKHRLPLPLIIHREFLRYSLDSYPLEFINIASDYLNIFEKEDLLKGLQFDIRDVRLQMEREFKSKWLHTRQMLLESGNSTKAMHGIISMSLKAILPILKGLFFLKGISLPKAPELIFQQSNDMTEFDISIIKKLDGISPKELSKDMVIQYLKVLEQLTNLMELWTL